LGSKTQDPELEEALVTQTLCIGEVAAEHKRGTPR